MEESNLIEKSKEELRKIIEDGGKIIKTTIEEKDKITMITKIEPVKGKATSSTIVTTKDAVTISYV